jgi:hypothetical protein
VLVEHVLAGESAEERQYDEDADKGEETWWLGHGIPVGGARPVLK